ncbi:MAG TPA: hypothetical protein VLE73_05190 [Candidatus Saccharimonadales bacterium]|nr:hypothetical protein [Candidatus Saccharimonadales bacterium]
MKVSGGDMLCTGSEAHWMQRISFRRMPGLAQKILNARIIFAGQYVSPANLPDVTIEQAARDFESRMVLDSRVQRIRTVEEQYAVGPDGIERHVHEVAVQDIEKRFIHIAAQNTWKRSRDDLLHFDQRFEKEQEIAEAAALFILTSDVVDAETALGVNEHIHDRYGPLRAMYVDDAFQETLHELQVTAGIIHALKTPAG